jgi:hypothetical protein
MNYKYQLLKERNYISFRMFHPIPCNSNIAGFFYGINYWSGEINGSDNLLCGTLGYRQTATMAQRRESVYTYADSMLSSLQIYTRRVDVDAR